ncbi:uncharacterized protein LOC131225463 [Magnolia sinica]|uniref:uncharacterized protein LOC131225463 n=1 Tax=Magnolia sinica TaxID=86752 RepID=UPI002659A86B|nr:uncharacterized protein LOC131225463 [Magnolia sinica]
MEVSMEVEDDVFFADLSKQIALLIMDDEDERSHAHCPSVSLQAFSHVYHPLTTPAVVYDPNCMRGSKGTGVFIPRSSLPRRRNRSTRFTSSSHTKSCKHSDKSRVTNVTRSDADLSCNYCNSRVLRRHD